MFATRSTHSTLAIKQPSEPVNRDWEKLRKIWFKLHNCNRNADSCLSLHIEQHECPCEIIHRFLGTDGRASWLCFRLSAGQGPATLPNPKDRCALPHAMKTYVDVDHLGTTSERAARFMFRPLPANRAPDTHFMRHCGPYSHSPNREQKPNRAAVTLLAELSFCIWQTSW
jgi:hypothetical protein